MAVKFSNNAKTTISGSITNSATSIGVADASNFPTLGAGDYTYATIAEAATPANFEIVKVTGISSNTLTIVRAQQGTSARSFSTNDLCELRVTSGLMEEAIDEKADLADLSVTTAPAGTAALSYNDTSGVFTFTPPDLSSYLTSYTETDPVVGAINGIVKADGAGNISAATAGTDYLTSVALNDVSDVTITSLSSGQVLKYNGSAWVNDTDSGGIALTDLSVTTNSVGTAALSYNNTTGVFSYTPPDLSSYLTSYTETDTLDSVTGRGNTTSNSITVGDATVTGNLTVQGTTTTLNTATLDVEDKNITINYSTGDSSGSADGAGITIQDAVNSTTDATILWDATGNKFEFSHPVDVAGNITLTGTVDGRDIATDGTKLDGIEASADVTDAANVAAAGAVMDSDFTANGLMKRTGAGTYTVDTNTYLTSYTETDPVVGAVSGIVKADGAGNISAAVAGTDYLSSYTETDTLDSVTGRGATTSNAVTVGNLTSTGIDDNATSTAITIDASENVGIGTTNFSNTLTVSKNVTGDDLVYFNNENAVASDVLRLNTLGAGSGTKVLDCQVAGVSKFVVNGLGDVGISETNPTSKLVVRNDGVTTSQLELGGATGFRYELGRQSVGGLFRFYGQQSGYSGYIFDSVDGERMRITSGGDVGIGVTSPTNGKLCVDGTINITDTAGAYAAGALGYTDANWGFLHRPPRAGAIGAHAFQSFAGSTLMTVTDGGNVGIGVTPSVKLDVATASGSTYVAIRRNSQSAGEVGLSLYGGTSGINWSIYQPTSSNDIRFYGNGADRLTLDSSGNLTATGNVTAYSDERLKSDVETLDGSKVYEMRGVSFTKDGEAGSGVIAQELQKVAPELVHESGEYLSVAYGNLVGYLIEAVKELKAEIEELKGAK